VAQWADFSAATADFSGTVFAVPGNSPAGKEGVSQVWDVDSVRIVSVPSGRELANPHDLSPGGLVWPADVLHDSEAERTSVVPHRLVSVTAGFDRDTSASDLCQTLVAFDVFGMFAGHRHRHQPAQPGTGGATWETIIGTGGATPTRGTGRASALPHLSPPEA
jgi:hypothetical protein